MLQGLPREQTLNSPSALVLSAAFFGLHWGQAAWTRVTLRRRLHLGQGYVMPINLSVSTGDLELGQGENVMLL